MALIVGFKTVFVFGGLQSLEESDCGLGGSQEIQILGGSQEIQILGGSQEIQV